MGSTNALHENVIRITFLRLPSDPLPQLQPARKLDRRLEGNRLKSASNLPTPLAAFFRRIMTQPARSDNRATRYRDRLVTTRPQQTSDL